jgi:hypothetical protein
MTARIDPKCEIGRVLAGLQRWTLLNADCRRGLDLIPDTAPRVHVISDPPYSEHVHALQKRIGERADRKNGRGHVDAAGLGFEALTAEDAREVAKHFARLATRWVVLFGDVEWSAPLWREQLAAVGVRHIRTGAWVKLNTQPQLSGDRPAVGFEAIQISHAAGRTRWNNGGDPGVWAHPVATDRNGTGERFHPTQKPIALMLELVAAFTDPDDVVIDPYAGSGTTAAACIRLGRRFIGFERNPTWWAQARERLEAETQGITVAQYRAHQLGWSEFLIAGGGGGRG